MPFLEPGLIKVPKRRMRNLSKESINSMAESMDLMGLLSPILVNQQTLVAGAHRLEAAKKLGWKKISVRNVGDPLDTDTLTIIEIDENLIRNELTVAERAEHIAVKSKILEKKYSDESSVQNPAKLAENCTAREKRQAASNKAKNAKKAKESIAADLGHKDTSHISAEIKNHEAVTEADLDIDKLDGLSASQFKEVAKTAKKDKKDGTEEAAKQLDAIDKSNERGERVSPKKLKSDQTDYVLEKISEIVKSNARIKMTVDILMSDEFPPYKHDKYIVKKSEDIVADIVEMVSMMREKFKVDVEKK